ncbi:MAG: BrnT family toxin [Planctomycetaceae bacterium]
MEFEWDERKAAGNRKKHGVGFAEATTIFADPLSSTFQDPDHSDDEQRRITIGLSNRNRVLIVSHVDRENRTRIISARLATRRERKTYEEEG